MYCCYVLIIRHHGDWCILAANFCAWRVS